MPAAPSGSPRVKDRGRSRRIPRWPTVSRTESHLDGAAPSPGTPPGRGRIRRHDRRAPEEPDLASLIERAYLIAIGLASLTATAILDAIARLGGPERRRGGGPSAGPAGHGWGGYRGGRAGRRSCRSSRTHRRRTDRRPASVVISSLVSAGPHAMAPGPVGRWMAQADVMKQSSLHLVAGRHRCSDRRRRRRIFVDLTALVADRVDLDAE